MTESVTSNMPGQALPGHLFPRGAFRIRVLLAMVRYRWFIRARWIIALATVALLAVERWQIPNFRRPYGVGICLCVLAAINVIWTLIGLGLLKKSNGEETVTPQVVRRVVLFANAQIMVDLAVLTAILRYSGGIENPMAVFYLFHMLIAALLLTPVNALLQGGWALLLYNGLAVGECIGWLAPHYPFLPSMEGTSFHADWAYVLAGTGVLAAGVFGTLYFTLQISVRLDQQERRLEATNDALRRSQVAIRDLQERRARFMQTAAHQLKSPLTGIEMLAGLICDDVVPPKGVKGVVERIVSRCREAIVQVTELLTLARVQRAAPARRRSARTNVNAVIERVAARFAVLAGSKNITFEADTSGCAAVEAAVDAQDLEACVANLVENAIKYTPEKGSVKVATASDQETFTISVTDTGMGIAEEGVDEIFDPFRRGNLALAADIPGSGLGLAIVREVVEQAHGRITVRSTVGVGSEFVLTLPRGNQADRANGIRETQRTMFTRPAKLVNGPTRGEERPCSTE